MKNVSWSSAFLYFITFMLTVCFCNIHKRRLMKRQDNGTKKYIVSCQVTRILTIMPFTLMCTFRDISVGYDTHNYFKEYIRLGKGIDVGVKGGFSFLNKILMYVAMFITNKANWAGLFVFSFCTMWFIIIAYEKIVLKDGELNIFSLEFMLLLYMLYLAPIMMDQSRQMIAVSWVVLALVYYIEQKYNYCFLLLVLGVFTHESVIAVIVIMIVGFLLDKVFKKNKKMSIAILVFSILCCIFIKYVVNVICFVLPNRFKYIREDAQIHKIGYGWIMDVFPVVAVLVIYYINLNKEVVKRDSVLELLTVSSIVFRLAGYYSYFIMRLSYYGEATGIVLVTYTLTKIKNKKARWFGLVLVFLYIIHFILKFIVLRQNGVVPYKIYRRDYQTDLPRDLLKY